MLPARSASEKRSVELSQMRNGLLCLLLMLGGIATRGAEGDTAPITRESLLGRWRGGDLTNLNCILVFEKERAHILTFRACACPKDWHNSCLVVQCRFYARRI